MRKCKNCGCAITRYKKDEYCPKCAALQDEPYKLFKRRTHRMLLIGVRDAVITAVLGFLVSLTPIGLYLKWYVFICAALAVVGTLLGYGIQTFQTNKRMYQEGYGEIVEENDVLARFLAKFRSYGQEQA
jgi:hypothetical protein